MARSNKVYYISPSAISLTPNCNGSSDDIAVYIASGTKIKVYNKDIPGLDYDNSNFQEWTLTGRNRRLQGGSGPYTIYARLFKANKNTGYLVFAAQTLVDGEWKDKYAHVTEDGIVPGTYDKDPATYDNWYFKLGEVSAVSGGERTITLDTGILGTEQWNNGWQYEPDSLPLRVDVANSMENANPPYVEWGGSVELAASLVRGWETNAGELVDHWEITRDTGDAAADAAWNNAHAEGSEFAASGQITLRHEKNGTDDFNDAVAATFTISAWGTDTSQSSDSSSSDSSDSSSSEAPEPVLLAHTTVTILAETKERYEIELSAHSMTYSPKTEQYAPAEGIQAFVRSVSQAGVTTYIGESRFSAEGLRMYYGQVEDQESSDSSDDFVTELDFTGEGKGSATLPTSAFSEKQSLNVWLENAAGVILSTATVAFVQDGEDGADGTSPCVADLNNEMDSIACDNGGKPVSEQIVGTAISLYHGGDEMAFAISGIKRNGTAMTYNSIAGAWSGGGVQALTDITGKTLTFIYNTNVVFAGPKDEYDITIGNSTYGISRVLTFTVNGLRGGALYGLLPSATAVSLGKDGTYTPGTLSCAYTKYDVQKNQFVTPADCIMQYFKDDETEQDAHSYTPGDALTPGTDFSAAVTFLLVKGTSVVDRETIAVIEDGLDGEDGADGTSPWVADLTNEMDSISCDNDGRPITDQTVTTDFVLFHGEEEVEAFVIDDEDHTGVELNGTPMEWNSRTRRWVLPYSGIFVSFAEKTLTIEYTTDAVINEKDVFRFTIADLGVTVTRTVELTVVGMRGGVRYSLLPSATSIAKSADGSYSPSSITCQYRKYDVLKNAFVDPESGECVIRYVVDDEPAILAHDYTGALAPGTDFQQSVTFMLRKGNTVIDRETVNIVSDGVDGEDGQDGVTYRCRWQLSSGDVAALASTEDGQVKYSSLDPTLKMTLMKRTGSGAETVVRGSGSIVIGFGSGEVITRNVFDNNMTSTLTLTNSPVNSKDVKKVNVAFSFTGGETLNFTIDKVFDGEKPLITIQNGNWYINGDDTGVKAEGKDGRGVALKGTVDVLFNSDITGSQTSLQGLTGMSVGDCYKVAANRHLYFYDGVTPYEAGVNPAGWNDLGEFQGADGEDGKDSYMHVAFADDIIFGESSSSDSSSSDSSSSDDGGGLVPVYAEGFTVVSGAGGHSHDYNWVGYCTDNNEEDPLDFRKYKWNYQRGRDGSGYEYVYLRSKAEVAPTIDESDTWNNKTRLDDEYLPKVANYSAYTPPIFEYSRFTDDPKGVSQTWPFEYQAVRKKTDGAWQPFSAATLHRKYGMNGQDGESPYAASLDRETAVVHVTGPNIPTQQQSITVVPSLVKGETALTPSVTGVKRNGTTMTPGTPLNGVTVTYVEGVIAIVYATTAVVQNGRDTFMFTIAHVVDGTTKYETVKVLTVMALGNDTYTLMPTPGQVLVKQTTGGFIPAAFTVQCGYSKTDIDSNVTQVRDVIGQVAGYHSIDQLYNIYFRRHGRNSGAWEGVYKLYGIAGDSSDSSSSDSSDSSEGYDDGWESALWDAVEFIICKNTAASVAADSVTGQIGSASVPVLVDGQVGATGPSYYYLGEWADTDDPEYIPDGTPVATTEYERPFVSYTQNGAVQYYMYIGEGTVASSPRYDPYSQPAQWELMHSQNKYIIARAIFSKYANFGSAIFNGDWLMSANGHIGNKEFTSADRLSVAVFGEADSTLIMPHSLFDILNPTTDGEQLYKQTWPAYEQLIMPAPATLPATHPVYELAGGQGFALEAGNTYYVRTDSLASGSGTGGAAGDTTHFYLQLHDGNGNKVTVTDLFILDSYIYFHVAIAFFRVQTSGTYYFKIESTPRHYDNQLYPDEYGSLWMESWSFGVARFVPRYAVDFLTGMAIQGYGFSSGAVRRSKVVIDTASFDYYTKPTTDAGYRRLDLEICGSYVEISSGYWPLLQLPMFCSSGWKIVRNTSGNDVVVPYTDDDRDYARSFVGTKLLIYITSGGIRCKYNPGTGIQIVDGSFVYRQSRDSADAVAATDKVQAVTEGQFMELECKTGTDADGEIVYWNVNTIGGIAGWQEAPSG